MTPTTIKERTMTNTDHMLVATHRVTRKRYLVEDDMSYNEALYVYGKLEQDLRDLSFEPAVRSEIDPQWQHLPVLNEFRFQYRAMDAKRAYLAEELAATAKWALSGDLPAYTFDNFVRKVIESMRERGFKPVSRRVAEDACKQRVTIARCKYRGVGRWQDRPSGCDRAYYWPRKYGRIDDHKCPGCGGDLSQTTLAYQKDFYRLDIINAAKEAVS